MAKRDFNVKNFLLQKGELVGLVAAGAVGSLLLLIGLGIAFSSPGAGKNAEELEKIASAKDRAIDDATPDDNLGKIDRASLVAQNRTGPVSLFGYTLSTAMVNADQKDDNRRRQPRILAPEEYVTRVYLLQGRSIIVKTIEGKDGQKEERFQVLKGGPVKDSHRNSLKTFGDLGGQGSRAGLGERGRGVPGGEGVPSPDGAGVPQQGIIPGQENLAGGKVTTEWWTYEQVKSNQGQANVRLAERVVPKRVALVVASFPFKKQLEEYQQKLRYQSMEDYLQRGQSGFLPGPTSALPGPPTVQPAQPNYQPGQGNSDWPEFISIEVQRRVVGGREGFKPIDVEDQIKDLIILASGRVEPEEKDLAPVIFDGMSMPRPAQFREGQYPKIEQELQLLGKALAAVKKETGKKIVRPPSLKDEKGKINPFKQGGGVTPTNPAGPDAAPGPGVAPIDKGSGERPPSGDGEAGVPGAKPASAVIPEYCLVRFLDTELEPGKTYEYQFRFKLKNPNFKKPNLAFASLGEREEIFSAWFPVLENAKAGPDGAKAEPEYAKVRVEPEYAFYAVDEKAEVVKNTQLADKDHVVMQAHRWIDSFFPDPKKKKKGDERDVGDWVVAERFLVARGEYVNQVRKVEVPSYSTEKEDFILVPDPDNRRSTGAKVQFGPDDQEMILIDFEGGLQSHPKPGGTGKVSATLPTEVLVMDPDGKLVVMDQGRDANDKERQDRVKAYRERINQIKNPSKKPTDPGGGAFDPKRPGGGS